jgi:hypothetical protein
MIVVSEEMHPNPMPGERTIIIIITRSLQLQATVKRFRRFLFDDLEVCLKMKKSKKQ